MPATQHHLSPIRVEVVVVMGKVDLQGVEEVGEPVGVAQGLDLVVHPSWTLLID